MNSKISLFIKSLLTDFFIESYLIGCLFYLLIHWEIWFDYQLIWLLLPAAFFSILFSSVGDSIGRKLFFGSAKTKKNWYRSIWGWTGLFVFILTFVVGWNIVQVNLYDFFTKFQNASGITSGIFDPNITTYRLTDSSMHQLKEFDPDEPILQKLEKMENRNYASKKVFIHNLEKHLDSREMEKWKKPILQVVENNHEMLFRALSALVETIFLALLATVFAIPFAFILSFFAARNLMPKTMLGNAIYVIIRTLATFFRSVEAIVWAIIFSVWVGIGPFAGMLALMIHSIAALTKLYSEQIENIDEGPVEAIKATGANTLQIWIFAVIPQIISPYLAFTIYRWDINVRMATIVGFVGGGGIGLLLQQQQQMLQWRNVGLIIWLIAIVVWMMDMISARIREKLLDKS